MESYTQFIQSAINKNETIVFSCNCEVEYSGRAEAFLPAGDRIVIIKADNTLLIHQPEGTAPVNYMKPQTAHRITVTDEEFFLKSQNLALKEYLTIKLNDIYFVNSHSLSDGQKLQLSGSEKDMAEMIYKNPELIEKGFKPLSMEEHTTYGFIDVFGHDSNGTLMIVECKRYVADLSAVTQLRRYVERIKDLKGIDDVRGIIAAPKISPNSEKMLNDWGFKFVAVEPPKFREKFNKNQTNLGDFSTIQ
ncbi:endonuclease NucS [Candidatus Woesearchaeota archaeon]|jgi:endonuclease|nr:endonuclease NucS [Candidatus Woesearchaeota archaeon]MBT6518757.1 endonuclease NucS [Candidatus Woesearchaeota archaeon]MBT7366957.1 endonuclease NucS [Candidatus Woesearchaeota archaeon]